MEDIVILEAFGPFTFKIIGIVCSEKARANLDAGSRRPAYGIEFSSLLVDVVFGIVAVQFFAAVEVLEVNVAAGLDVSGVRVIVDLVGLELHIVGFDQGRAPEVAPRPLGFLGDGANKDVPRIRGAGPGGTNPLIGIGTDGLRLRGGRESRLEGLGLQTRRGKEQ